MSTAVEKTIIRANINAFRFLCSVKTNEGLWNDSHPNYADTAWKLVKWKQVAAELGIQNTGVDLQSLWLQTRETFIEIKIWTDIFVFLKSPARVTLTINGRKLDALFIFFLTVPCHITFGQPHQSHHNPNIRRITILCHTAWQSQNATAAPMQSPCKRLRMANPPLNTTDLLISSPQCGKIPNGFIVPNTRNAIPSPADSLKTLFDVFAKNIRDLPMDLQIRGKQEIMETICNLESIANERKKSSVIGD